MHREVQAQGKTNEVVLPVRALSSVVLVLIIAVELHVLTDREQTSRIKVCRTPLAVLTFVEHFSRYVRSEMVRRNPHASLQRQLIAVAPGENSSLPVEIDAISV